MKLNLSCFIALFFTTCFTHAQWTNYTGSGSPILPGTNIPLVSCDDENEMVYLFSYDTSYHFYTISNISGFTHYAPFDAWLDTIPTIKDMKNRNGILWCVAEKGLYKFQMGVWSYVAFPAQFSSGYNGLHVMKDNSVWLTGGPGQKGFSHYQAGKGWTYYNSTTHPAFEQDMWLMDLKMDETDSVIWVGTNCVSGKSGVYSLNLKDNSITYYDNGNQKYSCIHAVAPVKGKTFVGSANFSSVRILQNGVFTQSLDAPKVRWVTEMRADPADHDVVWVLTDYGLMNFKDTANYTLFDTLNSPLKGYGNELTIRKKGTDSAEVFVGTTKGLYAYSYKLNRTQTGLEQKVSNDVAVWPNPTAGAVYFRFKGSLTLQPQVNIYQVNGKQVSIMLEQTETGLMADLSALPAGIYYAQIRLGEETMVKKLVLSGQVQ